MVKPVITRIGIVLLAALIVLVGRGLFFYRGFYHPAPSRMPSYENILVTPAPISEFSDKYTEGKGTILIDLAHDNIFDKEELNVLMLRLVSRGLTIKYLGIKDDLKSELSDKSESEGKKPAENLTPADAFIVVCPKSEFSREELVATDNFVSKGGKLLLIADPNRSGKMNSLSIKFGLLFEPDYLYNMKENDINYRNIFITDFKENELTKNLKKIALYTSGSISSANSNIAFVDENTFSSVIESREKLSPIALAQGGRVLAIYDLTFMTEPYNGILDNNQFISNIADWLIPAAKGTEVK